VDTPDPPLSMPVYTPATQFSDTTRGLCSAAYVDITFANDVIGEVVESERKAVPPSFGFDLDPVVRHCLRARRLLIVRFAVVTALLMVGLCLNGWATLSWLALCTLIGIVRAANGARLRVLRLGFVTGLVLTVICTTALLTALFVAARLMPDWLSRHLASAAVTSTGSGALTTLLAGLYGFTLLVPLALTAAMAAALFLSRWHAYGIMFGELAPGARASAPKVGNDRLERRLAAVAAMQRGNIAVHDTDPFAGAGRLEHGWSFAVTLKPRGDEQNGHRVALDPHELNRRVNAAVVGLRDTALREGERIPNVYAVPYVAADGYRRNEDPLIDRRTRTPYTMASAETIAAVEACPQGGLRHYLRVVVPANGKDIRTPDGRGILPAQDSGVSVTAFVHLAVEGGLLYAEFVALVLSPLRAEYRIADTLRADRVLSRAARDTLRLFVYDSLYGPWHLVRVGWDTFRLTHRMARSSEKADEYRYYDYGARFSVRDRAARETGKFMQKLDASKYIKLLDKTVTEAVLGYLREQGVDTTEFENNVLNYTFGDLVFHGGVQNFGGTNTVFQTNNRPAPGPRAKSGASRA